jgi:protein SCO1/2
MRPIAAAVALLAGVSGLAACGEPSSSTPSGVAQNAPPTDYAGVTADPSKPAPPLKLKDSRGKTVNIEDYRGKAVLVTFIYDHCPDICATIVLKMRAAQSALGPAANDLQIIAVSVDPKGDTSQTAKEFLADHQMTGRMEYLIGSRSQLKDVWTDWNIEPDPSRKDAVEHSALVYGISGSGRITTLYPADFKPQQIVHDVPRLAAVD